MSETSLRVVAHKAVESTRVLDTAREKGRSHLDELAQDLTFDDLIDIVSKNGGLLLNIGPKADGTIPEREVQMLREIGAWLQVNGEAIYGTRPWKIYGEGPTLTEEGPMREREDKPMTAADIRYTTKGSTLYAIALDWPKGDWRMPADASAEAWLAEAHAVPDGVDGA